MAAPARFKVATLPLPIRQHAKRPRCTSGAATMSGLPASSRCTRGGFRAVSRLENECLMDRIGMPLWRSILTSSCSAARWSSIRSGRDQAMDELGCISDATPTEGACRVQTERARLQYQAGAQYRKRPDGAVSLSCSIGLRGSNHEAQPFTKRVRSDFDRILLGQSNLDRLWSSVSATPSASLCRAVQAVTATAIRPAEMRRPALRRSCGLLPIRRDPFSDNTRLPYR